MIEDGVHFGYAVNATNTSISFDRADIEADGSWTNNNPKVRTLPVTPDFWSSNLYPYPGQPIEIHVQGQRVTLLTEAMPYDRPLRLLTNTGDPEPVPEYSGCAPADAILAFDDDIFHEFLEEHPDVTSAYISFGVDSFTGELVIEGGGPAVTYDGLPIYIASIYDVDGFTEFYLDPWTGETVRTLESIDRRSSRQRVVGGSRATWLVKCPHTPC